MKLSIEPVLERIMPETFSEWWIFRAVRADKRYNLTFVNFKADVLDRVSPVVNVYVAYFRIFIICASSESEGSRCANAPDTLR